MSNQPLSVMSLTPHMDHLTNWLAAEKARGLVDIKTFRDDNSVRILVQRVGIPAACEELAAEFKRMIEAPTLPDPNFL